MDRLLPLAQAVGAGALDSLENVAINVADHLGLPRRRQHAAELDAPLDGRLAIVTGGNAGIGFATARKLAERGATVVLACRSRERGLAAAKVLADVPPLPGCGRGRVEFARLDLASLADVRAFARSFNARGRRLDVLICNAGIMSPATRQESEDGLEMQFQVNFLSHWLLAHELLAEQRRRRAKAAKRGCGADSGGTRLVMLSSLTHPAGKLQWADKQSLLAYNPFTSYAFSKLANTAMALEFQRRFDRNAGRWGADSAVAIHPGIVHTALATGFFRQTGSGALPGLAHVLDPLLAALYPLVLRTPERSADSMLRAATAPAGRVAGRYLHNDSLARPDADARDPRRGAELWELATALTGVSTHASLA
ncbi:Dhrsx [Scenedesmus sp. PABB004]|nr:Dhrsx [Scenedesmus sp. PABB004]